MIKANENDRKGRKVGQAKVGRCGRLPRNGLVHQLPIFNKIVLLAVFGVGNLQQITERRHHEQQSPFGPADHR